MRLFATFCAIAALGASAAFADTLENAFGNTLIVTNAEGQTARYHFNADHSYMMMAGETHVMGSWEVAGGQICMTPQGGERACAPYDASKNVGDSWIQAGIDGSQITVSISAGR